MSFTLHEKQYRGATLLQRLAGARITVCGAGSLGANLVEQLARCGLTLTLESETLTAPPDFARLFPATGGAIYGRANHGMWAPFRRPGSRTRLPGLYLAGGGSHPGAGVPMAALSGRLAAQSVRVDLVSTRTSRPAAISGGMSTP